MWKTSRKTTLKKHLATFSGYTKLNRIIYHVAEASKNIKASLNNPLRFTKTGRQNAHGDQVSYMDNEADDILLAYCKKSKSVNTYTSEDREVPVQINPDGSYFVSADPIDGSSLLDVNLTVGTIVCIYGDRRWFPDNIWGAVYVLYGPLTTLVYAIRGGGVHQFILEGNNFILSRKNIELNYSGNIYGTPTYNPRCETSHHELITTLKDMGYRNRYSGCFAADANHILMKGGGLFSYPATKKYPEGKLRKLYELDPMSFIFHEAGGMSMDGYKSIICTLPKNGLETTSPVYIGSKAEVQLAEDIFTE